MTAQKSNNITIQSSITIHRDIQSTFSYIADLRLDKNWRKEINATTLSTTAPGLATTAVESSFLSKKVPDNKVLLKCTRYEPNNIITYESLPGERFYLMNSRQLIEVSENVVELTYTIEFELEIVKFGLGFGLPAFLVKFYTKKTMNDYLKKLRQILETK